MKQGKIKAHRNLIQKAQHMSARHPIKIIRRQLKERGEQKKRNYLNNTKNQTNRHFQMKTSFNSKKGE